MSSQPEAPAARAIGCVVADDHPAILDAVCRLLEAEPGFELLGRAANGESALQLIASRRPHVALLDIRMAGMGGIDVATKLATTDPEVAVVLFTAHADRALLIGALDAGVRGFILKDAPLEELLRAVRLVAGGGRREAGATSTRRWPPTSPDPCAGRRP
jgi:two-component system response regulator DesR